MCKFIDIHTHSKKNNEYIEIINVTKPTSGYNSIGIHPWDINIEQKINLTEIAEFANLKTVVAIGEAGIDRSILTNLEIQKQVFIEQVKISESLNLPMIIHCVRAWSDLLELRKKTKAKQPWIFHGYNGNIQTAQNLISNNCYLSFGIKLLDNPKIQNVFSHLPIRKIFLETDDSSIDIQLIYNKAVELKQMDLNYLKSEIFSNFEVVFKP